MSAYLEEHLPHLTSLHTQLALGPDALASDQQRIEAAIKTAVEELLRERETQVDEYKEVIAAQKRRMSNLARALGDKGRNVVDVHRRESMENDTLPRQLDRLVKQSEDLETVYEERIRHIESQQTILTHLAALLGPPVEPPKPLARLPAARSSLIQAVPLSRVVSGNGAGPSTKFGGPSSGAGGNAGASGSEEQDTDALYDVAEHFVVELDGKVQVALAERENRVADMEELYETLATLHTELALPPVPIVQPHHFPLHLLPNRAMEETPGANAAHEKLLARVVPEIIARRIQHEADGRVEEETEMAVEGLKGVEPALGMLSWLGQWEQEQANREARIQQLYDQIEPLWGRLQLDQDQMTLFTEMNCGCSEAAIRAYEIELERCLELRRSSLSSFILGARAEIEQLWGDLMLSEEETGAFGAFIDDQYTEELLAEHEAYAEELRAEITSKAALLPRVREWHALVIEEEELERLQNDPDRFKRRGGAMLKEEKSRKRVQMLKPKIEAEMLSMIPAWEEANARPFVVQGERVVDKIHEALEAKEAAKEAKKRARQGLGPPSTAATQSRALQPARTVRATPAPSARTAPSSTMLRKREAPTPTPAAFGAGAGVKRSRMGPPPSTAHGTQASIRSISASAGLSGTGYRAAHAVQGARAASATTMQGGGVGGGTVRIPQGLDHSTPCPQPRTAPLGYGQPHPGHASQVAPPSYAQAYGGTQSRIPSNMSTTSAVSSSSTYAYSTTVPVSYIPAPQAPAAVPPPATTMTISVLPPLSNLTSLAKANGRRPAPPRARRESFKPRQSLMRGMSMIRAEAPPFDCFEEGDGEGEGGFGDEALLGEVREELDGRMRADGDVGGLGDLREEMDVFE